MPRIPTAGSKRIGPWEPEFKLLSCRFQIATNDRLCPGWGGPGGGAGRDLSLMGQLIQGSHMYSHLPHFKNYTPSLKRRKEGHLASRVRLWASEAFAFLGGALK